MKERPVCRRAIERYLIQEGLTLDQLWARMRESYDNGRKWEWSDGLYQQCRKMISEQAG